MLVREAGDKRGCNAMVVQSTNRGRRTEAFQPCSATGSAAAVRNCSATTPRPADSSRAARSGSHAGGFSEKAEWSHRLNSDKLREFTSFGEPGVLVRCGVS